MTCAISYTVVLIDLSWSIRATASITSIEVRIVLADWARASVVPCKARVATAVRQSCAARRRFGVWRTGDAIGRSFRRLVLSCHARCAHAWTWDAPRSLKARIKNNNTGCLDMCVVCVVGCLVSCVVCCVVRCLVSCVVVENNGCLLSCVGYEQHLHVSSTWRIDSARTHRVAWQLRNLFHCPTPGWCAAIDGDKVVTRCCIEWRERETDHTIVSDEPSAVHIICVHRPNWDWTRTCAGWRLAQTAARARHGCYFFIIARIAGAVFDSCAPHRRVGVWWTGNARRACWGPYCCRVRPCPTVRARGSSQSRLVFSRHARCARASPARPHSPLLGLLLQSLPYSSIGPSPPSVANVSANNTIAVIGEVAATTGTAAVAKHVLIARRVLFCVGGIITIDWQQWCCIAPYIDWPAQRQSVCVCSTVKCMHACCAM